MNEHAGREQEIEARHHACSYLPGAVEICTVCFLLGQLREARKKLAAVEIWGKRNREQDKWPDFRDWPELDRILKGGD